MIGHLAQGFGVVVGAALMVLGWTWLTTALISAEKFADAPRGVRPLLGVAGLILCALGVSLAFAALDTIGAHR